jgi:hypothetical protein
MRPKMARMPASGCERFTEDREIPCWVIRSADRVGFRRRIIRTAGPVASTGSAAVEAIDLRSLSRLRPVYIVRGQRWRMKWLQVL